MTGNVLEGEPFDDDNWRGFVNGAEVEKLVRVDRPLFEPFVKTQTAKEAFKDVLKNVGANFPKQDAIDRRVIDEALNGTVHYTGKKGPKYDPPSANYPGIIDEPGDVEDAKGSPRFPWPEYRSVEPPKDGDHDGIPDDWERKFGLNPNDAADANEVRDERGYTNLEVYLGWLVGEFGDPKAK
jgi:pectate lyase